MQFDSPAPITSTEVLPSTVEEPLQETTRVTTERLTSIDALRGFDMFWIVGGDDIAKALASWWVTPQSKAFAEQFEHVPWEGFRFYDLIFPAIPVHGRCGLAVLAAQVSGRRSAESRCLWPAGAEGRAALFAGVDLQQFAEI